MRRANAELYAQMAGKRLLVGSAIQEVDVIFIIVDKPDELRVAANHARQYHLEQRHKQDSLLVRTESFVDRQVCKHGSRVPRFSRFQVVRVWRLLGGKPSRVVIADKNALTMLGGMILADDLLIVDFEHGSVAVCLVRAIGDPEGTRRGDE